MPFKIPNIFAAGTKAIAEKVNENFTAIEDWINDVLATGSLEVGDLKSTARSEVPAGWLLCDGSAVSRATYKELFDAIETDFGPGDGATTFNLPDYRGRTMVGEDGAAGRLTSNDSLGKSGGAEKHTLSTGELPSHSHGDGSLSAAAAAANHNHTDGANASIGLAAGGIVKTWQHTEGTNNQTAYSDAIHTHDVTGSTGSAGGGQAHNNMQPYQVCNILIKI